METIKKEYKVYKFEELDEEIKRQLIEKEKQDQFELYCDDYLLDDMEEKAEELLQKYFGDKAEFKKVCYSLTSCQGDGAMIEFDLYYYNKFVKVRQSGHYYHARSFKIDDVSTYGEYLTEKQEEKLRNKIIKMNEELESYGWKLVGDRISDEEAESFLRDFDYLENGEIF